MPSIIPSLFPTKIPSIIPSLTPSFFPTSNPSIIPTQIPTYFQEEEQSDNDDNNQTSIDSGESSGNVTLPPQNEIPTKIPTLNNPTQLPTNMPTVIPTQIPTDIPTKTPTVYIPIRYCVSWGDPHIVQFKDTMDGVRPKLSFSSMVKGEFSLFAFEEINIVEKQEEYYHPDLGHYANNDQMYILISNKKVFEVKCPTCGGTIHDENVVQLVNIRRSSWQYWPTRIHPSVFSYMVTLTDYPELRIFFRGHDGLGGILEIGVAFQGNVTETTGFCMEEPEHSIPFEPTGATCEILSTCCHQFLQNPVLYDGCLIDASKSCCESEGANEQCCEVPLNVSSSTSCGIDYFCSEGDCCNFESGQCEPCISPEQGDCVGKWDEYSNCSTTCGMGSKTRTFNIIEEAGSGGQKCDYENGEILVSLCFNKHCSDLAEDCEGSWSSYSNCTESCGVGRKTKTFSLFLTVFSN